MSGRGRGGRGGRGGAQQKPSDFKFDFGAAAPAAAEPAAPAGPAPLPKQVADRVTVLKHYQILRDNVEDEYQKELDALEAKYNALFQPFYEQRAQIVAGIKEPTAEEIASAQTAVTKREEEEKEEGEEPFPKAEVGPATDAKGVPEFWLKVLLNTEFKSIITEQDEEALKHVLNITAQGDDEKPLEITFTFSTNPFFSNTVLTKKYHIQQVGSGQVVLDHIEGATINWKEGKCLTHKKVTKTVSKGGRGGKRGGGKQGGARQVTTEESLPSFFHFFNPNFDQYEDEEDAEAAEAAQEDDYELGIALKEEVIPNAVFFFTGEYGAEEDDEEGLEYGDEDDDEDDEDDEDDDDAPPAGGAAAPQQQDCKQQ